MITCNKFLLPLLIFILPFCLKAQLKGEQLIDSLKQSLLTSKEDTIKAKALYRLARLYETTNAQLPQIMQMNFYNYRKSLNGKQVSAYIIWQRL